MVLGRVFASFGGAFCKCNAGVRISVYRFRGLRTQAAEQAHRNTCRMGECHDLRGFAGTGGGGGVFRTFNQRCARQGVVA